MANLFVYGDGSPLDPLLAQAANSFVVRAQRVWFGASGDQVATTDRYLETSTGAISRPAGPGPTRPMPAAFGLGDSDKAISTVDGAGVTLLAIQALERRTGELAALRETLGRLESDNAGLRAELSELRARVEAVVAVGRKSEARTRPR